MQAYVTSRYPSVARLEARRLATFEIDPPAFTNGEIDDSFIPQVVQGALPSWLFNPRQKAADARFAARIVASREANRQRYSAAHNAQREIEREDDTDH